MKYTMKLEDDMVKASTTLRASRKAILKICKAVNRKKFREAQGFVARLTEHESSIDGKFHDKAAEGVLGLLGSLENNARQKKVDLATARLQISAHHGPKLMHGRRRSRHGTLLKNAHVQAVLVPAKKEEQAKSEEKKKEK